jgi:hypothetical protein
MRDDVITWGVGQLPGELVRLDLYRAIATVLRLAGVMRGYLGGIVTPVRDGHYRPRSSSS